MKRALSMVILLTISVTLSGCYTEGGEGGRLEFEGEFGTSEGTFSMDGHVEYDGGTLTKDRYRNVTIEFYTENGTLLHEEQLGDMRTASETLNVSVSLSTIPYYVVIDSPDIWDGRSTVHYYHLSRTDGTYEVERITERGELPITPDG